MKRHHSSETLLRSGQGLARTLLTSVAISIAIGCAAPTPQIVVRLEISDLGTYSVDGHAVARDVLTEALVAKRQPGKQLFVHLVASSKVNYGAVEAAVKAARDSGASIGIVGNERF